MVRNGWNGLAQAAVAEEAGAGEAESRGGRASARSGGSGYCSSDHNPINKPLMISTRAEGLKAFEG